MSIVWPRHHQNELLFGLTDGKVKAGQLRTNRGVTVYSHGGGSAVVSLVCSPDGSTCIAGHLDGSIYRYLWSTSGVPDCDLICLQNSNKVHENV